MNQGWQWRAEWSPVHSIFIVYLRLNGFGTLLDGFTFHTDLPAFKCEKCHSSKTQPYFPFIFLFFPHHFVVPLASAAALTRHRWFKTLVQSGPRDCRGIIAATRCTRADGSCWGVAHFTCKWGGNSILVIYWLIFPDLLCDSNLHSAQQLLHPCQIVAKSKHLFLFIMLEI